MPIMPKDASCHDCEHWYWYADMCESYHGNCPHKKGCNRFRIKTYLKHGKYPDKNFKVLVCRSKKHYEQILDDLGLLCCLLEKSTNKQTKRTGE